jgi:uncharacterized protein with GYD domain
MPYYMVQASYTSEAWAAQIANPQDRLAALGQMIERNGGTLHAGYYSFGEYDVVLIIESPDNETAASTMIAAAAGGAVSNLKTTVLLTNDEGQGAIKGAGGVAYSPPGG